MFSIPTSIVNTRAKHVSKVTANFASLVYQLQMRLSSYTGVICQSRHALINVQKATRAMVQRTHGSVRNVLTHVSLAPPMMKLVTSMSASIAIHCSLISGLSKVHATQVDVLKAPTRIVLTFVAHASLLASSVRTNLHAPSAKQTLMPLTCLMAGA